MADITLNVTIPEEHQQKFVEGFTLVSGKELELSANSQVFDGRWSFVISQKQQTETMKEFGERAFRELGIAVLRLVALYQDTKRYRIEVGDIKQPEQDVPDDILV